MKTKSEQFFYDNASYCYDPKIETQEQGHERCAKLLAKAEQFALENDFSYEWAHDEITSEDHSDEQPFYPLWLCIMHDSDGNHIDSLGGIDFGPDGKPWGNNYRRVVEAELALDCEQNNEQSEIFIAGYNMAGYMPETEPSEFDSFDDAKRSIIHTIKRFEDEAETETSAENFCELAEDVNLESDEFSVRCEHWVFWVTRK